MCFVLAFVGFWVRGLNDVSHQDKEEDDEEEEEEEEKEDEEGEQVEQGGEAATDQWSQ